MRLLKSVIFERAVSHGLCRSIEEAQAKESWNGEELGLIRIPMVVECRYCAMTMTAFRAYIHKLGIFICQGCVEEDEYVDTLRKDLTDEESLELEP